MWVDQQHASFVQSAKRLFEAEIAAAKLSSERLGEDFVQACQLIQALKGKVICTGIGKSGHIAGKIAATLASTGTPAFFVHPAEAAHGDLGMLEADDLVLALSHSGETEEILRLLPAITRRGLPIIAICGKAESSLARAAQICLLTHVEQEACPLGLAPTTSTTVSLMLGDALAVALLEGRGFSSNDFALFHPAGALGRKLLVRADDVMRRSGHYAEVGPTTPILDALLQMTQFGMGMVVVTEQGRLCGVYTDGDLRRSVNKGIDLSQTTVSLEMSKQPKSMAHGHLASEAAAIMQSKKVTEIVVLAEDQTIAGVLTVQDLLRAGVI